MVTPLPETDDLRREALEADPQVAVLAKEERSAMLQVQSMFRFDGLVGDIIKDAVVENFAVLINLDESRALVVRRPAQYFGEMVNIDVRSCGRQT